MLLEDLSELQRGLEGSVLNTSGFPRASASVQKPASSELDNHQATTYRLCQSMVATR